MDSDDGLPALRRLRDALSKGRIATQTILDIRTEWIGRRSTLQREMAAWDGLRAAFDAEEALYNTVQRNLEAREAAGTAERDAHTAALRAWTERRTAFDTVPDASGGDTDARDARRFALDAEKDALDAQHRAWVDGMAVLGEERAALGVFRAGLLDQKFASVTQKLDHQRNVMDTEYKNLDQTLQVYDGAVSALGDCLVAFDAGWGEWFEARSALDAGKDALDAEKVALDAEKVALGAARAAFADEVTKHTAARTEWDRHTARRARQQRAFVVPLSPVALASIDGKV